MEIQQRRRSSDDCFGVVLLFVVHTAEVVRQLGSAKGLLGYTLLVVGTI